MKRKSHDSNPTALRRQNAPDSTFWVKHRVWTDRRGKTVTEETTDYRDYLYLAIEFLVAAGLWVAQENADGWLRILLIVIACAVTLHALVTTFAIIGARAATHYLDREIRAVKHGDLS